jgi:hypothetical protein
LVSTGVLANPDPCLVVYPDAAVVYHYESTEYYTVTFGHPLYDPFYDRGGEVLIDILTDEIALNIYQAPGLAGFQLDNDNQGFYTMAYDFTLIVDGWSNQPTTFGNILLVFDQVDPEGCSPIISIDGNPALWDASLGWYYPAGSLDVVTPTADGNNYSDVLTFDFSWTGCQSLRIWAFDDENFDLSRDGNECFSAFSHDLTVPAEPSTWGGVKAKYR